MKAEEEDAEKRVRATKALPVKNVGGPLGPKEGKVKSECSVKERMKLDNRVEGAKKTGGSGLILAVELQSIRGQGQAL